jgi:K+-sensing histidine kinase KdpD
MLLTKTLPFNIGYTSENTIMVFINKIIKKLSSFRTRKRNEITLNSFFSQLSHDLKNNLIAIRASAGNIKASLPPSNEERKTSNIDKVLAGIDKKVNDSIYLLKMTAAFSGHTDFTSQINSTLSAFDCIKKSIQCYPFLSEKHALLIVKPSLDNDFYFEGNEYVMNCIFYCLIKNALHSIFNLGLGEAVISLEKEGNKVHLLFTESIGNSNDALYSDLFALGTPEKPGNGLKFIIRAMNIMKGTINFKRGPNKSLTISLLLQKKRDTHAKEICC